METSGPQLTKNLEVRRCLEKMLEQNEAGFRQGPWKFCANIPVALNTCPMKPLPLIYLSDFKSSRC